MNEKLKNYTLYALATLLFIRILQYSWVTDDAFITFRSVINLVAGHGPVFNIGERVQSFTHPLWFLLLSVAGWLDLNLYFFAILLGLACSGLTILSLFKLRRMTYASSVTLGLAFACLAASESFVSFSTSGLENSLTFLLIVNAIIAALDPLRRYRFYLFAALALVNRFDSAFILAPLAAWIFYSDWQAKSLHVRDILVGALPLVAWHSFSLIYYGFIFPNTKYAKVGGRMGDNISVGVDYLADSFKAEWASCALLVLVLAVTVFLMFRRQAARLRHSPILAALACGILLHLAYVIFIAGGDFMRGRFLTNIVFVCAAGLLFMPVPRFLSRPAVAAVPTLVFGALLYKSAWIGAKEDFYIKATTVANERNFYKFALGLNLDPQKNYVTHPWGVDARKIAAATSTNTGVLGVTGQRGYWIPTNINLVDPVALTDAFIARLPVSGAHRTGHIHRDIPAEYLAIKIDHRNVSNWRDKDAEQLYNHVRIVTETPELFSGERFKSMVWLWRHYGI